MKRDLNYSPDFIRAAKRFRKKHPPSTELERVLEMLHLDAFDPRLKTHKLGGKMAESWSCSAGYDLRVIFSFAIRNKKEAILLESMGTHDEVY